MVQLNYINYKPLIVLKNVSENYSFFPKGLGFFKFQMCLPPPTSSDISNKLKITHLTCNIQ